MSNRDRGSTDRVLRTAAWVYLTPRVIVLFFTLIAVGLAAFLLLTNLAVPILR